MEYVLQHTLFCRYIHFVFEFCDTRTWYVMLFLLLWILGGLAAILYCLISSTGTEGRLEDRAANEPSAKFSQLQRSYEIETQTQLSSGTCGFKNLCKPTLI